MISSWAKEIAKELEGMDVKRNDNKIWTTENLNTTEINL